MDTFVLFYLTIFLFGFFETYWDISSDYSSIDLDINTITFRYGSNWYEQQSRRVYCSPHSASPTCHMTRQPDRSYQKLSATKRHRACAIEIDNAHYLSQLFCTIYCCSSITPIKVSVMSQLAIMNQFWLCNDSKRQINMGWKQDQPGWWKVYKPHIPSKKWESHNHRGDQ